MVKLIILLLNFLMIRIQKVMNKKFQRKKRNIKREKQREIKGKSSRKVSTQENIVTHLMTMMIVTMT
jgi:hypothetical protein